MGQQQLVDLELAKRLKEKGYSKPCEYYWQAADLPFSVSGLKKTKKGEKMNHNIYDEYIYSAPSFSEAIRWLKNENLF